MEDKVYTTQGSSLGDPGAIGTCGFATTTLTLSLFNAGLLPEKALFLIVPLAFFYGGIAQVLAGMWEIKKNNTLPVAIFTTFGMFWVILATLLWLDVAKVFPFGPLNQLLGVYLSIWLIPTLIFWIASFKSNWVLWFALLMVILLIIFGVIGNLDNSAGMNMISAWSGILAALAAYYLCLASCVNSTFGKTVLSVGPMK